jgi:biotin operon repressor/ribosomal protein S27AE
VAGKYHYQMKYDPNKPWTDEQRLRILYHEDGMTQQEIADKLGCARSTISECMAELGIDTGVSSPTEPDEYHDPDGQLDMACGKCGYEWTYTGTRPDRKGRTRCPDCGETAWFHLQ